MIRSRQKIQRQERVLSSLDKFTYATSDHLCIENDLGSNRNARKILYELEKDKLIRSIRQPQKIYYLTNKGNDSIGKGNKKLTKSQVQHCLMRNDLYIKLGMPSSWKREAPIIINDETFLVSDARFKHAGKYYFVEVDNKQSMRNNTDKVKRYKELFEMIYQQDNYHPQLIWYTLSDVRKKRLEKVCINEEVNFKIY